MNARVDYFGRKGAKTVVHMVNPMNKNVAICGRDLAGKPKRYENYCAGKETYDNVDCSICVTIIKDCKTTLYTNAVVPSH